jgi:hypothetical protein
LTGSSPLGTVAVQQPVAADEHPWVVFNYLAPAVGHLRFARLLRRVLAAELQSRWAAQRAMNDPAKLVEEIGRLERQHLDPDVRASAALLADLLAEDFLEIGASGRVFDRAAIISSLPHNPALEASLADLVVSQLAPDVALATYQLRSRTMGTGRDRLSLRSSLWIRRGDRWRLRFHQGTQVHATPRVTAEQHMPRAVFCRFEGDRLAIHDALELRERTPRSSKLSFVCEECGQPVRPHRAGTTGQAAHFEHYERNPECRLSDPLSARRRPTPRSS